MLAEKAENSERLFSSVYEKDFQDPAAYFLYSVSRAPVAGQKSPLCCALIKDLCRCRYRRRAGAGRFLRNKSFAVQKSAALCSIDILERQDQHYTGDKDQQGGKQDAEVELRFSRTAGSFDQS